MISVKCEHVYSNPLMGLQVIKTGDVDVKAYEDCLFLEVRVGDGQIATIQLSPDSADDVAGALRIIADRVRRQVAEQAVARKP